MLLQAEAEGVAKTKTDASPVLSCVLQLSVLSLAGNSNEVTLQ